VFERSTTEQKKLTTGGRWVVTIFVIVCLVASYWGLYAPPGSTSSAKVEGGGSAPYNASDKSACMHAHNVLVDVNEGILTVAELRAKIQEVRDDALTPGVQAAATKMLSAVTKGSGVATATAGLISACSLV
jgi:hypothetical protein